MLGFILTGSLGVAGEADAESNVAVSARHLFPALGMVAERKVPVEWNRYHDHEGLHTILAGLNAAFPDLTKLYSIGKSVGGREIWCLEVTAHKVGDASRKTGMWIDGNIHGNEVQAGEVVAYTAWYLCHQYGHVDKVTELLNQRVFYLVPTINPDGRDHWFHSPNTAHSSRSGIEPFDNDRDGLVDEDDMDDLDGDGSITMMRIKDPDGRYKPHPDYPKSLMVRVKDDERGEYTLLGNEGIDNDGDGRVNEDGLGGYDGNRNWPVDWQPNYVQYGSQAYPASLPETRAVIDFVIAHPNIAAMQSYHNSGGMILRAPGREGGAVNPRDDQVLRYIADRGEKIIPFYDSKVVWRDLYTVWGGEFEWFYARGVLGFTNELWTPRNLYRDPNGASDEQSADFIKYVLMNEGLVEWKEFDHPTYGKIEIGGMKKEWQRIPPSFLLEEECHRNMAFTLYHADMMPLIAIRDVEVERLGDSLYKIWVTIENNRLMPTRPAHDVANKISPPDVVMLKGPNVEVLSSGRVTDRYFKRVEATKIRPERVEIQSIEGMSAERVQFIVTGKGEYTITVDSAKGGLVESAHSLP